MHFTGDHDALLVFPINGIRNCNTSIALQNNCTLCFCSVDNQCQFVQPSCAFPCLESRTRSSNPTTDIYRTGSSLCIVIFVTLCLWRFTFASAELSNLNPMPNSVADSNFKGSTAHLTHSTSTSTHLGGAVWNRTKQSHNIRNTTGHLPITYGNISRRYRPRTSFKPYAPESKMITMELSKFICHRLPDPCARAAYLRQYAHHILCPHLPLLYLLPYVVKSRSFSDAAFPSGTCEGSLPNLIFSKSDSLFEPWLHPPETCLRSLLHLQQLITAQLKRELSAFDELLKRSFCKKLTDSDYNVTGEFRCEECRVAYTRWLCASEFPLYYPLDDFHQQLPLNDLRLQQDRLPSTSLHSSANSTLPQSSSNARFIAANASTVVNLTDSPITPLFYSQQHHRSALRRRRSSQTSFFRLIKLNPCPSWCTQVETSCPYFNPQDGTSNGGEPAFLCDESHYHHSSQYSDFSRLKSYCDSSCCFTESDLFLMSSTRVSEVSYETTFKPPDLQKTDDYDCRPLHSRCYGLGSVVLLPDVDSNPTEHSNRSWDVGADSPLNFSLSRTSLACQLFTHRRVYFLCILQLIIYLTFPYSSWHTSSITCRF